jgi:hypothetical protein
LINFYKYKQEQVQKCEKKTRKQSLEPFTAESTYLEHFVIGPIGGPFRIGKHHHVLQILAKFHVAVFRGVGVFSPEDRSWASRAARSHTRAALELWEKSTPVFVSAVQLWQPRGVNKRSENTVCLLRFNGV